MDAVAVTIQYGRYRATVHYESCAYYKSTYHHSKVAIPASMQIVLCKRCEPVPEDIASIAGELDWIIPTADAMSRTVVRDWDTIAEKHHAIIELNGGRTLQKLPTDKRYFK